MQMLMDYGIKSEMRSKILFSTFDFDHPFIF